MGLTVPMVGPASVKQLRRLAALGRGTKRISRPSSRSMAMCLGGGAHVRTPFIMVKLETAIALVWKPAAAAENTRPSGRAR